MPRTLVVVLALPLGEHDDPHAVAQSIVDQVNVANVPNAMLGMASYAVSDQVVKQALWEHVGPGGIQA